MMIICGPNRMQLAYAKVSRAAGVEAVGGRLAPQKGEEEIWYQLPSESPFHLSQRLSGLGGPPPGAPCKLVAGVPANDH